MLRQFLHLIATGKVHTKQELTAALHLSDTLVDQLAAQLQQQGYLIQAQSCDSGCNGCALKTVCGESRTQRFWALTAKGKRAAQ